MLLKALRCNYLHITGLYIFFWNNSPDSTEMINMGMAVNHCLYRKSAQILFYQGKSRCRTFHAHQWIYYNPSRITSYEGDIWHIIATHLIDSIGYFKKTINMIQLCISPKTWIRCIRSILIQKSICCLTPYKFPILIINIQSIRRRNQTFCSIFKLLSILEIQQCINFLICINGILGGWFAFRC